MSAVRVLLVEDEALVALHTRKLLESAGYTVVGPAARLDAAVELAERSALDAAVLDVHLAGLSVWPVAEVLQRRGIGFVFLSGSGNGLLLPPAYAATTRIDKPFLRGTLLDAIADVLRRGTAVIRRG